MSLLKKTSVLVYLQYTLYMTRLNIFIIQYTPSCNEKSKQFQNTLVIMLVCRGFATILDGFLE